ncbi:MAG TPA: glycosyl hydrolase 108 family protein [Candidatus Binataceae bacterium]|nr:glycosyl hydrolase 108 family protein [Candidatus Binataceae bacterium]
MSEAASSTGEIDSGLATSYPPAFVAALEQVLGDEGGLVDDPADGGGETKYGISQRQYPEVDIAGLTRTAAAAIYYRDWWARYDYSALPAAIGSKLFNLAVNLGPEPAARCVQRALRACGHEVGEDGVLGPATRAAAAAVDGEALLAALRSEAAGVYREIAAGRSREAAERERFLAGWLRRAYE